MASLVLDGSRSPYGERGLKFVERLDELESQRRSPYGERGLKYRGRGGLQDRPSVALLTESVD